MDLTGVEMTCSAFPSQWEARTPDGRFAYIRYRWGTLTVDVARDELAWEHGWLDMAAGRRIGGPYAGEMTTEAMLAEVAGWPDPDPVPGRAS